MLGVRSLLISLAVAATILPGAAALAAEREQAPAVFGVWRNPKNTVHVDIRPCGAKACGVVVWATAKAQEDVRKGSGQTLIGLQLFRDLAPHDGRWNGKVLIPDLNMTFSGAAERTSSTTLRAKGCLIGVILCKSQIWTRIEEAAG